MRIDRCISLSVAVGLFLCGCGFHGGAQAPAPASGPAAEAGPAAGAQVQAPERLVYAADSAVYSKGVAIAPNTPYIVGGAVQAYRVNPALPAGLSLAPATGVISGTPTAVTAAGSYEVTGSNGAGSASTTLTLTVIDQAPAGRPAVTIDPFVTEAVAGLTASTPDLGTGMTYAWTLQGGTITAGQGTPSITYTAGAPGALTASVAVTNTGGTVTGSAAAEVVPKPDATLTVPVAVRVLDGSKQASVPQQAGMTYLWTLVPGTATATLTSGQGTHAVGFTAGGKAGTFQVQVKVSNQAGNYLTTSGTIKVETGY